MNLDHFASQSQASAVDFRVLDSFSGRVVRSDLKSQPLWFNGRANSDDSFAHMSADRPDNAGQRAAEDAILHPHLQTASEPFETNVQFGTRVNRRPRSHAVGKFLKRNGGGFGCCAVFQASDIQGVLDAVPQPRQIAVGQVGELPLSRAEISGGSVSQDLDGALDSRQRRT